MSSPLSALVARGQLPTVTEHPTLALPAAAEADALAATRHLIERLEAQLTPHGPTHDPDWYGWIPLSLAAFYDGMRVARRVLGPGRHRFLDVGSGIGTKLILAHELGYHAHGIERWAPYVDASRRIAPFAHVVRADAAQLSADGYRHYDLIYYYGLAPDQDADVAIKRRITDHMRGGALFFCARHPLPEWLDHVDGLVWRKP